MGTTPEIADSFEVVVSGDGSLTVPAAELARHGVRPGTRLRLVKPRVAGRQGGRSAGKLAGLVPDEVVEAWSQALDDDRAERRSAGGPVSG
ncbi:hypothetical protein [Pseudonocardia sp. WMMC193]|uniref:hypothetical protein n=1 Tax=Pseudonocardia sp. WMMC193 TaxID=2911965 RepID=UPI001F45B0D3|nr:hypothetical protein [Pseudonocardia sp. WMMC193]MCF7552266.1 hypothetical protein [Pseudonocardia sp. WMMC193]